MENTARLSFFYAKVSVLATIAYVLIWYYMFSDSWQLLYPDGIYLYFYNFPALYGPVMWVLDSYIFLLLGLTMSGAALTGILALRHLGAKRKYVRWGILSLTTFNAFTLISITLALFLG